MNEKNDKNIINSENISKNVHYDKNLYPQDTMINDKSNKEKINEKEDNIISTILQTNKNKNDILYGQDDDKIENKTLYKRRNSKKIFESDYYNEQGDFSFINNIEKVKPFLYQPQINKEYSSHAFNNFHFLDIVNTYKMIINIIIDDDSLQSSNNLDKILNSIVLSLKLLKPMKINNNDCLVCIYFQHFSKEEIFEQVFSSLDFYECKKWNKTMNTFVCSYGYFINEEQIPINILSFYKESSTFVEIYKFFFCNVLNDLIKLISLDPYEIGKTLLVVNWPNGKLYDESIVDHYRNKILSDIFRITNNRNMILVPDISYITFNKSDHFGYINKYNFESDKVYINLIWDMMCAYPIDHRYFYINMNYNLYLILKEYYQNNIISIYASEYYHDYNLSIYLQKQAKDIVIQKDQQVKIVYGNLSLNLLDIFYDFTLKRGSELANILQLFPYFFTFRNLNCIKFLQKFVLLYKLICFIAEFFWLGLSLLISYAVFNETFGSKSNNMDYFCSLGYAIIVILLIFISSIFIKNKPKIKRNLSNRYIKRNKESYVIILILYIIHYVFNIFFFVCCIISVIKVSKGENENIEDDDYYIFNKNYFVLLLILNILFALIPNLIRATNLTTKGFFFYLIFQFPNSTCFFHIPYLFICTRNINSEKKSIESLYISLYLLLNGIFTVICIVFDTKRHRRMDFFFVIATILLVLNGIKILILIFGCCWQNRFNRKISIGQIEQYNYIVDNDKNNSKIIYSEENDKNNKDVLDKEQSNQPNIKKKEKINDKIILKKENNNE